MQQFVSVIKSLVRNNWLFSIATLINIFFVVAPLFNGGALSQIVAALLLVGNIYWGHKLVSNITSE